MIEIRNAEEKDAEVVALLLHELGYPNTADFAYQRILNYTQRASSQILIAVLDGKSVGFLAFDAQPLFHQAGNIGCIMALCVRESARGKGVGTALVKRVEEIASALDRTKIAVASGVRRSETHRFYLGLGYEEITKRFVKQLC